MSNPRVHFPCVLLSAFIGLLVMPGTADTATRPATPARVEPTKNQVVLYAVEFDGTCGPPVLPGKLGAIITSSAPKDWTVRAGGLPPLVSREAVVYSVVGTSGVTSLPAARVFAEVRGGGELSFKSDKGQNVVLQADIKSVCWDVDQERAVDLAKTRGSGRVLFAVMHWEDMTADVNPGGELGRQKSVQVSLDMTLLDTSSGIVLGSFADESRQMDLSATAAVRRGAKALVAKGFRSLTSDNK